MRSLALMAGLSAAFASLICSEAALMVLFGFGTPNLAGGESLSGWWLKLWFASAATVPLGWSLMAFLALACNSTSRR